MTGRPPLTSPDADLQDFPFMPLHVARLRDSDLAAEGDPEGCWYAVLLWAAGWKWPCRPTTAWRCLPPPWACPK